MSADADVLAAFFQTWTDQLQGTIPITRVFSDDLPADLPFPYAQINSTQGAEPQYQAPVLPGDDYLDTRRVAITIVGIGKANVGRIVGVVDREFNLRELTVPNAGFRMCAKKGERLEQEPQTESGERLYRGVLEYDVWTVRKV